MARRGVAIMVLVVLAAGCGDDHSVAPTPTPSPSSPPPGGVGFLNGTRCNALRAEIRSDLQAHAAEVAIGHGAEAERLRAKITAELGDARAVPGCEVTDLMIR